MSGVSVFPERAIAAFDPPPGNGTPIGTAGGGSRPAQPACLSDAAASTALTVLAPSHYVGLTAHSHPTVWVYIPPTRAQQLEFSLFDAQGKGIYQTTLPIAAAGLISISLPTTAPALAERIPHYWTVALVCNPDRRTDDWVAGGGWIERRSLTSAPTTPSALAQVSLLANTGYWYDALDNLMQLRQTQPHSPVLASTWITLLQSAGLEAVPDKPLTSQAN